MEDFEFEEEYEEECLSLYEEEEMEYYYNVLYPQIDTLNRR